MLETNVKYPFWFKAEKHGTNLAGMKKPSSVY